MDSDEEGQYFNSDNKSSDNEDGDIHMLSDQDETYYKFVRSVFEDDDKSEFECTDDDEEDYIPTKDVDDCDDDDDDDDDSDLIRVQHKELRELVDGCWQTIIGEAPQVYQSENYNEPTIIGDCSEYNGNNVLMNASSDLLQNNYKNRANSEAKAQLDNFTNKRTSVNGEASEIENVQLNEYVEEYGNVHNINAPGRQKGSSSVISNMVSKIFSSGSDPSEVCIDGLPVNAIRKLVARQMSMATQLLLQILMQADDRSECFTKGYTSLMELSNLREGALRKTALIQMNVMNATAIKNHALTQRNLKKEAALNKLLAGSGDDNNDFFNESSSDSEEEVGDADNQTAERDSVVDSDDDDDDGYEDVDLGIRRSRQLMTKSNSKSNNNSRTSNSKKRRKIEANDSVNISNKEVNKSKMRYTTGGNVDNHYVPEASLPVMMDTLHDEEDNDFDVIERRFTRSSGAVATTTTSTCSSSGRYYLDYNTTCITNGSTATTDICELNGDSSHSNSRGGNSMQSLLQAPILTENRMCNRNAGGNSSSNNRNSSSSSSSSYQVQSVFNVPALTNISALFDMIDKARQAIKLQLSNNAVINTKNNNNNDISSGIAHTFKNASSGSSSINFSSSSTTTTNNNSNNRSSKASLFAAIESQICQVMPKLRMRPWLCLVPTVSYPLTEALMIRMDPNTLTGRCLFTPAEDDLLLRGIIHFGDGSSNSNWEKISIHYVPSKEAQLLQFQYTQMTSLSSSGLDNNFKRYQKLISETHYQRHREAQWTPEEELDLFRGFQAFGSKWPLIRMFYLPHRKNQQIRQRWQVLQRVWQKAFQGQFYNHNKTYSCSSNNNNNNYGSNNSVGSKKQEHMTPALKKFLRQLNTAQNEQALKVLIEATVAATTSSVSSSVVGGSSSSTKNNIILSSSSSVPPVVASRRRKPVSTATRGTIQTPAPSVDDASLYNANIPTSSIPFPLDKITDFSGISNSNNVVNNYYDNLTSKYLLSQQPQKNNAFYQQYPRYHSSGDSNKNTTNNLLHNQHHHHLLMLPPAPRIPTTSSISSTNSYLSGRNRKLDSFQHSQQPVTFQTATLDPFITAPAGSSGGSVVLRLIQPNDDNNATSNNNNIIINNNNPVGRYHVGESLWLKEDSSATSNSINSSIATTSDIIDQTTKRRVLKKSTNELQNKQIDTSNSSSNNKRKKGSKVQFSNTIDSNQHNRNNYDSNDTEPLESNNHNISSITTTTDIASNLSPYKYHEPACLEYIPDDGNSLFSLISGINTTDSKIFPPVPTDSVLDALDFTVPTAAVIADATVTTNTVSSSSSALSKAMHAMPNLSLPKDIHAMPNLSLPKGIQSIIKKKKNNNNNNNAVGPTMKSSTSAIASNNNTIPTSLSSSLANAVTYIKPIEFADSTSSYNNKKSKKKHTTKSSTVKATAATTTTDNSSDDIQDVNIENSIDMEMKDAVTAVVDNKSVPTTTIRNSPSLLEALRQSASLDNRFSNNNNSQSDQNNNNVGSRISLLTSRKSSLLSDKNGDNSCIGGDDGQKNSSYGSQQQPKQPTLQKQSNRNSTTSSSSGNSKRIRPTLISRNTLETTTTNNSSTTNISDMILVNTNNTNNNSSTSISTNIASTSYDTTKEHASSTTVRDEMSTLRTTTDSHQDNNMIMLENNNSLFSYATSDNNSNSQIMNVTAESIEGLTQNCNIFTQPDFSLMAAGLDLSLMLPPINSKPPAVTTNTATVPTNILIPKKKHHKQKKINSNNISDGDDTLVADTSSTATASATNENNIITISNKLAKKSATKTPKTASKVKAINIAAASTTKRSKKKGNDEDALDDSTAIMNCSTSTEISLLASSSSSTATALASSILFEENSNINFFNRAFTLDDHDNIDNITTTNTTKNALTTVGGALPTPTATTICGASQLEFTNISNLVHLLEANPTTSLLKPIHTSNILTSTTSISNDANTGNETMTTLNHAPAMAPRTTKGKYMGYKHLARERWDAANNNSNSSGIIDHSASNIQSLSVSNDTTTTTPVIVDRRAATRTNHRQTRGNSAAVNRLLDMEGNLCNISTTTTSAYSNNNIMQPNNKSTERVNNNVVIDSNILIAEKKKENIGIFAAVMASSKGTNYLK